MPEGVVRDPERDSLLLQRVSRRGEEGGQEEDAGQQLDRARHERVESLPSSLTPAPALPREVEGCEPMQAAPSFCSLFLLSLLAHACFPPEGERVNGARAVTHGLPA